MASEKNGVMVERELSLKAQHLKELLKRTDVEHPKDRDVQELRDALQKYPGLWQALNGDLCKLTTNDVVDKLTKHSNMREAVRTGIELIQKELGYEHSSELERLLIGHITLCWVSTYAVQLSYNQRTQESMSLEAGAYWDRHLDAAHWRYLRACESLARVRRLLRPVIGQLNIAERQTNIAGLEPNPSRKTGE